MYTRIRLFSLVFNYNFVRRESIVIRAREIQLKSNFVRVSSFTVAKRALYYKTSKLYVKGWRKANLYSAGCSKQMTIANDLSTNVVNAKNMFWTKYVFHMPTIIIKRQK